MDSIVNEIRLYHVIYKCGKRNISMSRKINVSCNRVEGGGVVAKNRNEK